MTLEQLHELAAAALPTSDDEWGSERQVEAENAFAIACEEFRPHLFAADSAFDLFAMKATTDERVAEALRLVSRPDFAQPIATLEDGRGFIDDLVASGVMFHLEDSPETIIESLDGRRTFNDDEAELLRLRVAELYALAWGDEDQDPLGYYLRAHASNVGE